jgi:hypothetical protein
MRRVVIDQDLADAEEIERKAVECVKAGEHRRAHSHGGGLLSVDHADH